MAKPNMLSADSVALARRVARPAPPDTEVSPVLPELPEISLLQQRFLEARVLGPLIRAFQREVGAERAAEIAGRAILEFDVPSYRTGAAQKRLQQEVYQQK